MMINESPRSTRLLILTLESIISPLMSGATSRPCEADAERQRELSPSPAVELSSYECEHNDIRVPPIPTEFCSGRPGEAPRNHCPTSPPLEKDEKEFTQTALAIQMRKLEVDVQMSGVPSEITDHPTNGLEADSLFGADRKLNVLDLRQQSPHEADNEGY